MILIWKGVDLKDIKDMSHIVDQRDWEIIDELVQLSVYNKFSYNYCGVIDTVWLLLLVGAAVGVQIQAKFLSSRDTATHSLNYFHGPIQQHQNDSLMVYRGDQNKQPQNLAKYFRKLGEKSMLQAQSWIRGYWHESKQGCFNLEFLETIWLPTINPHLFTAATSGQTCRQWQTAT